MSNNGGYYDNKGNWVDPDKKEWWKELIPYAIVNALSLSIACSLLKGITFSGFGSIIFAAVLLTLVNWGLKPFVFGLGGAFDARLQHRNFRHGSLGQPYHNNLQRHYQGIFAEIKSGGISENIKNI